MNASNKKAPRTALSDPWWERSAQVTSSPSSGTAPILGPYRGDKPGFEFLSTEAFPPEIYEEDYGAPSDGAYQVCLWNIWKRDGDPAESDEEKQLINEMQRHLGPLDDDTRLTRIQIASLARCFWTFPNNVEVILTGIAQGTPSIDQAISCEPPWCEILGLLRMRSGHPSCEKSSDGFLARFTTEENDYSTMTPRQEIARAYLQILHWWTAFGSLGPLKEALPKYVDLAEATYRYLGPPTGDKYFYVQRFCLVLSECGVPHPCPRGRLRGIYDPIAASLEGIIRKDANEKDEILELIKDCWDRNGPCHHSFERFAEHIVAAIGAGGPVSLPGGGERRKRFLKTLADYVHALASWLAERSPEEADRMWAGGRATYEHVCETLGPPNPTKRWLVACLWKRLLEDKAQAGRGPIDEKPDFALPREAFHADTR